MSLLTRIVARSTAEAAEPPVVDLSPLSLDHLIQIATSLGGLRVYQYERGRPFSVTIKFERRSGSEVEAKATHSSLPMAVQAAIDEARALGASA